MIQVAKNYITSAWNNCPSSESVQTHAKNLTIALPVINFSFLAIAAACARQWGPGIEVPVWPCGTTVYPLGVAAARFEFIAATSTVLAGTIWTATACYNFATSKSTSTPQQQPRASFAETLQNYAKIATVGSIIFLGYRCHDMESLSYASMPPLIQWTIFQIESDDDLICRLIFPIIAISGLTWGVSAFYNKNKEAILKACALFDVDLTSFGIKTDQDGLDKLKKIICSTFALLAVAFGALAIVHNRKIDFDFRRALNGAALFGNPTPRKTFFSLALVKISSVLIPLAAVTFIPKYCAVNNPPHSTSSTTTNSSFDKLKNIVYKTYLANAALSVVLPIVAIPRTLLRDSNLIVIAIDALCIVDTCTDMAVTVGAIAVTYWAYHKQKQTDEANVA